MVGVEGGLGLGIVGGGGGCDGVRCLVLWFVCGEGVFVDVLLMLEYWRWGLMEG